MDKNPRYGTFDVRIYPRRDEQWWWKENLLDEVMETPAGVFIDDFSGYMMLSGDTEVRFKLEADDPFHKRDFLAVKIINPAQGEWYARFLMEVFTDTEKKDFRKLRVMRLKPVLERLTDNWQSSIGGDDDECDRRKITLGEALQAADEWSDGRFFPKSEVPADNLVAA